MRCNATFTTPHGIVLRCQCEDGHDSVHYYKGTAATHTIEQWWPNRRGLPRTAEPQAWNPFRNWWRKHR